MLILHNGRISTQDQTNPWAQAVAIDDNRFLAVGPDSEIKALASPGDRLLDLGGRLALPGMTDSHIHTASWAKLRKAIPLARAESLAQVLEWLAAEAGRLEPGQWIVSLGLDETRWPEGRLPDRHDLDKAAPDHPVYFRRRDGHMSVANSLALKLAGVDSETPDPSDGYLEREENGRPNGRLMENAQHLVGSHVPALPPDQAAPLIAEAIGALHELGVTGLHDVRILHEGSIPFKTWRILEESGRLGLRCWMCLSGEHLDQAAALGLKTGFGSQRLKVGNLKYFLDGSMGSRTAWVTEPYPQGDCGVAVCSMEEMGQALEKADKAGLTACVHAIGDRAVKELIDLFESLKTRGRGLDHPAPHRIEHCQMIRPQDVERLSRLKVVASVQPLHVPDDIVVHDQYLGEKAAWVYTFRSLMEAGVPVIFGSDAPVSDPNPLWGIHAAATRQRQDGTPAGGWYPEERISVDQAVRAYTLAPALATGQGHLLGSISPGKLADLIVLDRDIFSIDTQEIASAQVDLTVFDGRVVFER